MYKKLNAVKDKVNKSKNVLTVRILDPQAKVWFVDDVVELTDLYQKVYYLCGGEKCDTFGSVEATIAALEANSANPPKVIVIDMKMKDGTGVEVIEWAKVWFNGTGPTFVVISATPDLADGVKQYVHTVIGKPFENMDIMASINGALKSRRN